MDGPFLQLLLLAPVAAGATYLARADRQFRPASWLLWSGVASDLVQRGARLVYGGTRLPGEHYTGLVRGIFHVAQFAHVSWPLGVMALGWWQIMPARWCSPWPVGVVALVTGYLLVTTYPTSAPDDPSPIFYRVELLVAVATVGLLLAWLRNGRARHMADLVAVTLLLFEAAILVGPYDVFGFHDTARILLDWDLALVVRVVLYTTLAALGVTVWRRDRRP